eukprot:m.271560 g.271560  ORF g.271560 m.271560 type:complete len:110 (+) comp86542_c0_seq1:176-505(+)
MPVAPPRPRPPRVWRRGTSLSKKRSSTKRCRRKESNVMSIEVRVPTLGESVSEATIATWFKKPGDAVSADEMLCELETDKVTVEVPAPASGTLSEEKKVMEIQKKNTLN